ncbi:MAG: hypothetical protein K0S16_425 [Moraxellaceae bacterium]|nr:hypothetical protein [Moraxellaceae bacterium]
MNDRVSTPQPVMARLRAETRDAHARIEATPFFRALADGSLGPAGYASWLRALAVLHEAVRHVLARSRAPVLQPFRECLPDRLALLDRDLVHFHGQGLAESEAAILRAHVLAQAIRLQGLATPAFLLGALYVLEGSALGGLVLRDQVARSLGLEDGNGTAYLAGRGKETQQGWQAFGRQMESAVVAPVEQDTAIAAAGAMFAGLLEIAEVLHRPESARKHRVQELNAEAGGHAVTEDAQELQAALLAGEKTWTRFPYYRWRYGDRGLAFTRSDSAWLAQLAQFEQEFVDQQVRWLARVLAARGMPRLLLEQHLQELQAELVVARPECEAAYARLGIAAEGLARSRREQLDDAQLEALAQEFDRLAGADWAARLPHTGALLAAATADEAAGIFGAVTSLRPWFSDAQRFPPHWIAAVDSILAAAHLRIAAREEAAGSPAL